MGKDVKWKISESRTRKSLIEPNETGGSWYAKVDPDTGAIQWIRRKIKRRKKR